MLLHNTTIITPEGSFRGYVEITGELISTVGQGEVPLKIKARNTAHTLDLEGKWLLPGVIDDQVHFRDPGLTHKGDIATESRAAIAGGVTSFMDMPNTVPQTTTIEAWEGKMKTAAEKSLANYAFFFGATNTNIDEIENINPSLVPGLKVFLGSSTGNMLVNDAHALQKIFSLPHLIAIHSEDEDIIKCNVEAFKTKYPEGVPMRYHSEIRSSEACYICTSRAIKEALKFGTRLHVLHVSTAKELDLIADSPENITAEVCVHHLLFTKDDYDHLSWRIKWNPSVKSKEDRARLLKGLTDGSISVIATDHAPHLITEKEGNALSSASGGPSLQFSLLAMLSLTNKHHLTKEKVVDLMCASPAKLYKVDRRGEIKAGNYADLVIVDPNESTEVRAENIISKCGWSPYEGMVFPYKIWATMVNGSIVYQNNKIIEPATNPARNLVFLNETTL